MVTKNKKPDNFSDPIGAKVTKDIIRRLDNNRGRIHKKQYELDQEDIDLNSRSDKLNNTISKRIESTLNNITSRSRVDGSNSSTNELDAIISMSQSIIKNGNDRNNKITQRAKSINDVRAEIVKANSQSMLEMVQNNKSQVNELLTTYNMIIKLIPKMRLAIKTIANTIISPDDFTKSTLATFIEDRIESKQKSAIVNRVDDLIEAHELNKELQNDVITYLKNGDLFFLALSQNEQIKRMLTEGVAEGETKNYSSEQEYLLREEQTKILNEDASKGFPIFSDSTINSVKYASNSNLLESGKVGDYAENNISGFEKQYLTELFESFNITVDKLDGVKLASVMENVNSVIANEFIISNSSTLVNESNMLNSDFLEESANNFFYNDTQDITPGSMEDNVLAQPTSATLNKEKDATEAEKAKIRKMKFAGRERPILRRVSKANIVPLEFNGKILGYLHLDLVEIDPDGTVLPSDRPDNGQEANSFMPSQATGNGTILQNMVFMGKDIPMDGDGKSTVNKKVENPNGSPGLTTVDDARLNFIANVFTNKLSRDTNIRILRRNPALKNAIYTSLSIKQLNSNEKIRVVYLKPEEVIHISRGQSIFDNVLFFSKIYIASLVTILTQNIMRGSSTRVVYCEVGLDNNPANSVQQVIRDLKSKQIASVHNMDLQTILNVTGEFTDMYIPVIDGEKPISFDSIDAQNNKALDDEFLTWLSNNIFSGIGLPASYVSDVESVDFAKTLAMQNTRFLRDIISDQAILGDGYTKLIRRLYYLTYNVNENRLGDDPEDTKVDKINDTALSNNDFSGIINFDVNNIDIRFPSPASLNVTNINDQLSNLNSVVDGITQNIEFDKNEVKEDEKEVVINKIKNKLIRQFAPSIDWDSVQHTVDETLREIKEEKIRKGISNDEKKDAGMNDDDMM